MNQGVLTSLETILILEYSESFLDYSSFEHFNEIITLLICVCCQEQLIWTSPLLSSHLTWDSIGQLCACASIVII